MRGTRAKEIRRYVEYLTLAAEPEHPTGKRKLYKYLKRKYTRGGT